MISRPASSSTIGDRGDRLDDVQAEDREEEPDRERQPGDDGIGLARRLDERLEPADPEEQVLEPCDQHGERQEEQADPQEEPRPARSTGGATP